MISVRIYKGMPQGTLVVNFRNFTWSRAQTKWFDYFKLYEMPFNTKVYIFIIKSLTIK